jgi:hypothetical protein
MGLFENCHGRKSYIERILMGLFGNCHGRKSYVERIALPQLL